MWSAKTFLYTAKRTQSLVLMLLCHQCVLLYRFYISYPFHGHLFNFAPPFVLCSIGLSFTGIVKNAFWSKAKLHLAVLNRRILLFIVQGIAQSEIENKSLSSFQFTSFFWCIRLKCFPSEVYLSLWCHCKSRHTCLRLPCLFVFFKIFNIHLVFFLVNFKKRTSFYVARDGKKNNESFIYYL